MEKRRVLLTLLGIAVVIAIGIVAYRRLSLQASVSYPSSVICSGNECIRRGGNSWCQKAGGLFCRETSAAPCYECVTSLSSASSSSTASTSSAASSALSSAAASSSSFPWFGCATNYLCDVQWSNDTCIDVPPACSSASSGIICGNENCIGNCYICPPTSSTPAVSSQPASSVASSLSPAPSSSSAGPAWEACPSSFTCLVTRSGGSCNQVIPTPCEGDTVPEYENTCGDTTCVGACYRCVQETWVDCQQGYTCDRAYDGATCNIVPLPENCSASYLPESMGCGTGTCDGRCFKCN